MILRLLVVSICWQHSTIPVHVHTHTGLDGYMSNVRTGTVLALLATVGRLIYGAQTTRRHAALPGPIRPRIVRDTVLLPCVKLARTVGKGGNGRTPVRACSPCVGLEAQMLHRRVAHAHRGHSSWALLA